MFGCDSFPIARNSRSKRPIADAADALEAFVAAKALVGRPPRDWLCLTMLGEMHGMTPDQAFFDGSRAGFTKALGREWESCQARVVDVSPDRGVDSIAELLCDELAAPDGSPEVFHGPDGVQLAESIVGYRLADFYGAYLERAIEESRELLQRRK